MHEMDGLFIDGHFTTGAGTHVIVRDSVISGNVANGIRAFTQPGKAPAFAIVERSSIVDNNQNGILADGPGATLLLSDSTVSRNGTGIATIRRRPRTGRCPADTVEVFMTRTTWLRSRMRPKPHVRF